MQYQVMKINRISLCKERKKDEALFEKKKEEKKGRKRARKGESVKLKERERKVGTRKR